MNISKYTHTLILLSIIIIAFILRMYTSRFQYILLNDPYYHFYVASLYQNTQAYPLYNFSINYPYGVSLINHPPGLVYFPSWFHSIFKFFGMSFFKTFQILPAIFGTASIVPLYFISSKLYNRNVGFFASLLYAVSFGALERSFAGNVRGDVFMLFFMLCAFYLFLMACKSKLSKMILYSIFSGIMLFLCRFSWNGWHFAYIGFLISFLFYLSFSYFKSESPTKMISSYLITILVGLSLLFLFEYFFYNEISHLEDYKNHIQEFTTITYLSILMLFFSFILILFVNQKMEKKILAFVLTSLAFVLVFLVFFDKFTNFPLVGVQFFSSSTSTIMELYPVNFKNLSYRLSILLLLVPLDLVRNRNGFVFGWFLACLSMIIFGLRFVFLAVPIFCLLGDVFIDFIQRKNRNLIILISIILFLNAIFAFNYVLKVKPWIDEDFAEGLEFLKNNTDTNSTILAWWDYTPVIVGLGKRMTIANFGTPQGLSNEAYSIFSESPEKSFAIAKKLNVDFIIVDERTVLNWKSIKEFSQSKNLFENSLLFKLYIEEKVEGFEVIFSKGNVKMYKTNYSRSIEMGNPRKMFYRSHDKIIFPLTIKNVDKDLEGYLAIKIRDPKGDLVYLDSKIIQIKSGEKKSIDIGFIPTNNSNLGQYQILAEWSNLENKLFFFSEHAADKERVSHIFYVEGIKKETLKIDSNIIAEEERIVISGKVYSQSGDAVSNADISIFHSDDEWTTKTDNNGRYYLEINKNSNPPLRIIYGENIYDIFVRLDSDFGSLTESFDADFSCEVIDLQYFVDGNWQAFEKSPVIRRGETLRLRFRIKTHFKHLSNSELYADIWDGPNTHAQIVGRKITYGVNQESNTESSYEYLDIETNNIAAGKYWINFQINSKYGDFIYIFYKWKFVYSFEIILGINTYNAFFV